MRIIHISFGLGNGGKENMLVDIANEQKKLGHVVTVIIINDQIDDSISIRIEANVRLIQLHRKPGSHSLYPWLRLFFILNLIKQPDIIHCHDYHLGRILSRINNAKRVLTVHGMGLEIAPLKYFDQLFAISFAVKKNIEYRSQYKCKVIYNGLLLDQIRKKGSYSLGGTLRIITIKRLNHVRTGQDLLIEAIGRLVKNHCEIDFQLSLVGEGKSRTYLEKQIADLHLNTNVVLLGNKRRDWIYEHLCDYDLCILPSRFEGFGLVLAESMAAKVPIIASNIDGPAEILEKGKYGFLFEKDNTNDLALKINTVVSYYKTGNIIEMTEKAYQHCKMNFNVQTTAINYCEAYQEIL